MTLTPELQASILRYYHVEKWRVGTIARQLHVHHSAVRRVLAQAGLPPLDPAPRPAQIDAYLPFIRQTLERFPTLTASRIYAMVRERGYRGSPDHFRHLIALHRPRRAAEAYLRLSTLLAEQGQIDWGHFGYTQIGRARRPLMAFVAVLSWSRQIYLRFFVDARMESFLRGHIGAFEAWQGLPRVLLYDNLKSAVLERQGDAIRFHPTLLAFAAHYRFEPRPVAVARGNEKGRVERAIRYVRESFFAARKYAHLEDLNVQAAQWCNGQAADRICPAARDLHVGEAFRQERPQLIRLPENPFPTDEIVAVTVGKTPYVRFDLNDYSVPHTAVGRLLSVRATPQRVRVLDGATLLADHPRSYDRGAQVEDPAHVAQWVAYKRQGRQHRATNRLMQAVPASREFLVRAAARGSNLGALTMGLLRLLERYGATELQAAIEETGQCAAPHPNAVRLVLERRREARHAPPPVVVSLPAHVREKDAIVQPHRLDLYDQLTEVADDRE